MFDFLFLRNRYENYSTRASKSESHLIGKNMKNTKKRKLKAKKKRPIVLQIAEALKDVDVTIVDYTTNYDRRVNKKHTLTVELAFKYKKS